MRRELKKGKAVNGSSSRRIKSQIIVVGWYSRTVDTEACNAQEPGTAGVPIVCVIAIDELSPVRVLIFPEAPPSNGLSLSW